MYDVHTPWWTNQCQNQLNSRTLWCTICTLSIEQHRLMTIQIPARFAAWFTNSWLDNRCRDHSNSRTLWCRIHTLPNPNSQTLRWAIYARPIGQRGTETIKSHPNSRTLWCTIFTLPNNQKPFKFPLALIYDSHTPYWTTQYRDHPNSRTLRCSIYTRPIGPNDTRDHSFTHCLFGHSGTETQIRARFCVRFTYSLWDPVPRATKFPHA